MNNDQQPAAYEGWAVLELMGHRRIGGHVQEVVQYGTTMIRIDVPADEPDGQPITQFYGGTSIYCLSPTTEESARAVARYSRPQPVHQYELTPPVKAIPQLSYWCPRCEDGRVTVENQLCDTCQQDVADENPRDDLEDLPL
jgi:hypothetical protein